MRISLSRKLIILAAFPGSFLSAQMSFSGHYQNWTAARAQGEYDFILLRNRLRFDTSFQQEGLRGFLSLDVRNDRINRGTEFEITLREGYIDLYFPRADLRIGKQQVVWGKADGLFINDIVCPLDMRLFLLQDFDNIRMGLSMIKANLYFGQWGLEGIWIPDFQAWEFAPPGSDWEFSLGPPDTVDILPDPAASSFIPNVFHVAEPSLPRITLRNSEFGLKVSSFLLGADVNLLFLGGFNDHPSPQLDSTVVTMGLSGVEKMDSYLNPHYYRSNMYGLNFSRSILSTVVRAEMGYFSRRHFPDFGAESFFSESDYFQGMVGVDFTGPFQIGISIQGIRQQIMDHTPTMMDDEIRHLATVLLRGSFWRETATAFVLGIFDPSDEGGLGRISFDYRWVDGLTLSLGTDILWGESDSIFGQFNSNDNIFFRIKYYF